MRLSRAAGFGLNNIGINMAKTMENGLDYELKVTTRFIDDRAISYRDDPHITSFYSTIHLFAIQRFIKDSASRAARRPERMAACMP